MFASSFTAYLGLFLAAGASALPHGIYSRATVNVQILTQTQGEFGACSAEQVQFINDQVDDVVKQARAASAALRTKDITTAPSFVDFLPTNVAPATIASEHYDSIVNGVPATIPGATAIGTGAKDLTFICQSKCKTKNFFAFAVNAGQTNSQFTGPAPGNIVMMCPTFFGKDQDTGADRTDVVPNSLATAAKLYTSGTRIGNCPSMTLLHEFQHLSAFVGASNVFVDQKVGGKLAYPKALCTQLDNAGRAKNAQSFAWFAFEAAADPARAKPCPPAPAPASPKSAPASPKAAPASPKKVPRALKKTVAKPAAKAPVKVAPKPAPVKAAPKPAPVKAAPKPAPVKAAPKPAPVKAAPKPVAAKPAPVKAAPVAAKPAPVKAAPVAAKPVAAKAPAAAKPAAPAKPVAAKAPAAASCPARTQRTGDISFDFTPF